MIEFWEKLPKFTVELLINSIFTEIWNKNEGKINSKKKKIKMNN